MRIDEIDRQPCSLAKAMTQLGDAWSVLILREAFYGRSRFSDFVKRTGAQKTVVSARLKALVEAEILERVVYSEHPTRHRYLLTEKGRELAPVLLTLVEWGDRWLDNGRGKPVVFLHRCGNPVDTVAVCGGCGEPLHPNDIQPQVGPGYPPGAPDPFARPASTAGD